MDQNEEIFVRFMNDLPFQKVVTAWMASEAYQRLRSGTAGESHAAAPRGSTTGGRPKLRIVQPRPEDRYVTSVPLVPLKAAAGAFSDPQHVEDDNWEWVAVDSKRRLHPGMFVAQIVGKSMEPTIPDGSYCLFRAPIIGTRQGKIVLVQLRDATDPDNGERYTVKRYQSEKVTDGDSWRHARITLKPLNPDFQPIELTGAEEGELQVVAELVEVLGGAL
jgi:SOS-response transcriptional repressor LexA